MLIKTPDVITLAAEGWAVSSSTVNTLLSRMVVQAR